MIVDADQRLVGAQRGPPSPTVARTGESVPCLDSPARGVRGVAPPGKIAARREADRRPATTAGQLVEVRGLEPLASSVRGRISVQERLF